MCIESLQLDPILNLNYYYNKYQIYGIFLIQLNLITLYYVNSKLSFLILNENIVILNLTYPTLPSLSLIKRTQTKAKQMISNTTEIVPIKTKPLMFSILFSFVASGG